MFRLLMYFDRNLPKNENGTIIKYLFCRLSKKALKVLYTQIHNTLQLTSLNFPPLCYRMLKISCIPIPTGIPIESFYIGN